MRESHQAGHEIWNLTKILFLYTLHTTTCTHSHVVMVASVCRTAILYSTIVRVAWKTYIALQEPMMTVGSECCMILTDP